MAAREPLISVLLPVHNDRRFVGRAVDSILGQTFRDFDLIVLDDGSTDGSMEVVQALRDPRLKIIRNGGNVGVARTLNAGLAAAESPLVARMDADDISEPTRFERQVDFLEANPGVALVGTWATWIDETDRAFTTIEFPTDPAAVEQALLEENCIFHPSVMFRREAVQALGGYPLDAPAAQDYELWLRLSERHALANLPEHLLRYRVHRAQVSFRKMGLQRRVANAVRYEAARRRHRAGRLPDPARYAPPGFLARMRGSRGSTGAALTSWVWAYRMMGRRSDALALALLACVHSPLNRRAYADVRKALQDALWPPAMRSRVAWYATRLRSVMGREAPAVEPVRGASRPGTIGPETRPFSGVSVVICTLNRSSLVRDAILTFEQAIRIAPPSFPCELVVVDNGSTDDTADVVSRAMRELDTPIRYLHEPLAGLSNARNSGARAAKYDVIAFVDDDVFVRTGWLNAIGGAFAAFPQIACVGGNTIPVFESGRPSWVDDSLLPFFGATRLGETRREMRYPEHPFGVNMAIRRAVLDAIGGFNPGLGRTRSGLRSNEESDLFRRASAAGFRTLYEPAAVLEHRVPAARAQQRWILSRSYWQGVSDVLMHCIDVGSYSRRQLLREGFAELLGLLRETHGGHVSPRRIFWHLHGLPFEAKVHRAYRAGKARQLIAGGFGL